MNEMVKQFLAKVAEIKAENPTYRQPGYGADGTCDCIGLIIGAARRIGCKWTGIHGSNWAARRETSGLAKLTSVSQLSVGDLVYKAKAPGAKGYALPARYKQGGAYCNGDLNDYYHVGVVTGLNPVRITHMTSPAMKVDESISKWTHCGSLTMLLKITGEILKQKDPVAAAPIPSSGATAVVTAPTGRYVKMRQRPTTSCGLYEEVPIGGVVKLEEPGEVWAKISYGKRKNWYMMAKFLEVRK